MVCLLIVGLVPLIQTKDSPIDSQVIPVRPRFTPMATFLSGSTYRQKADPSPGSAFFSSTSYSKALISPQFPHGDFPGMEEGQVIRLNDSVPHLYQIQVRLLQARTGCHSAL